MYKKVEVWILCLIILLGFLFSIGLGTLVRLELKGSRQLGFISKGALFLAEIPINFLRMMNPTYLNESYTHVDHSKRKIKYPPSKEASQGEYIEINKLTKGYILVSSYSPEYQTSTVKLFDLKQNRFIYSWVPEVDKILKLTKHDNQSFTFTTNTNKKKIFRTQHPLLSEDGGIIFHSGEGSLVKIDKCSHTVWTNSQHFHHSIERGSSGHLYATIVVPYSSNIIPEKYKLTMDKDFKFRNDGFAILDEKTGKIIKEYSMAKILFDNGYDELFFLGTSLTPDYFHLNDADPIKFSDHYVAKGDVMLSSRTLSMISLYRPSSNKVIWLKIGPWTQQHDIDYVGDGIFTVYNNSKTLNITHESWHRGFKFEKFSSIYEYDMKSQSTKKLLYFDKSRISHKSGGRQQKTKQGHYFIDDEQFLYILDKDQRMLFLMYFPLMKNKVAAIHWSRYLDVINKETLKGLKNAKCKT